MLKTSLPESITLKCGTVLRHRTSYIAGIGPSKSALIAIAKAKGSKFRCVEVLGGNLRGKTDLHRRPYEPSTWILSEFKLRD